MNLAQMKTALENSVKEALIQSVDQKVEIKTLYDANSGSMLVEMVDRKENTSNNTNSILCYNIRVTEETRATSIVAFNRVFMSDSLGVSLVNNEPVAITSNFMTDITNIILVAMDKVYHPENYAPVAEEAIEPALPVEEA
jgi:hypothetical protein